MMMSITEENSRLKRKASQEFLVKDFVYIDCSPPRKKNSDDLKLTQLNETVETDTQVDGFDDSSSVDENQDDSGNSLLEQEPTIPTTSESPVTVPRQRSVHCALFPPGWKAGCCDIDDSTVSAPDDLFDDFCESEEDDDHNQLSDVVLTSKPDRELISCDSKALSEETVHADSSVVIG
jgi:hypothetical protein